MDSIRYRAIYPKDYATIKELITQSFGLYNYVSDPSVLDAFKKRYLYSCLAEATYACVAEKDGSVIGVIMGNAKSKYRLNYQRMVFTAKMIWYANKMRSLAKHKHISVSDFDNLHKIYHHFNKRHSGEFDGVLTLFAVSEVSRGLGVGKRIWNGLNKYLENNGVKSIYLYTDSTCNTGFYEHAGFRKADEDSLIITSKGIKKQLSVYLYTYTIQQKAECKHELT